ncbi:hypothetical protein BGZ97_001184 [Linnemannia gamsii]|uniref:C2H2-type domain-containing protein n=1 Tax=Linnemannia gamsii TaxID=64522 RepID=A0A9P6R0Y7_9FUNG|nr:hypothetical protein BGZ97_001184 [Linnemannia gamsii]
MDGMDVAMAMHQQSKRMAGLSITNATGTKVSILNDSSAELGPSSVHSPVPQSSPISNSPRDTNDDNSNEHSYSASAHDHYLHDNHNQQQKPPSRQRPQDAPYETARSSSLTNASTPIYSVEELAASQSSLASSSSDSKTLTPGSQRSRSLSRSSKQSPTISSSAGPATPTYPFFTRSYSEDGVSEDPSSGRRMSDPASDTGLAGVVKRKYSCTFLGCNKCFTTSGHLARHNRIHTGERNFRCLLPGCSSKFSRQDNMMQHYRTHISTKSRRGVLKKHEYYSLGLAANHSQEALSTREHSPAVLHSKMNTSRQGPRQNSPPRFSPFDRSNSVDYPSSRSSSEFPSIGGAIRHKSSGVLQTHQHHTPLPHLSVHAMSMAQHHGQSGQGSPSLGNMPSFLTPTATAGHPSGYHHQPAYISHSHLSSSKYAVDTSRHPLAHRSDAALASPTSPMTQDVERMEGVAPSLDQDRPYHHHHHHHHHHNQYVGAQQQPSSGHYQQQYPSQKQYQRRSSSPQAHAGHAHGRNGNGNQLPPLSLYNQERLASERSSVHPHHLPMPPSPQSTPQTPTTKYRFDPIQDCLQQEKYQQREHGEQREQQYDHHGRYHPYNRNESLEDEDGSSTTGRSSIISSKSSMTSLSSASSSSLTLCGSNRASFHGSHSNSPLHKQQQHHHLQQEQHQQQHQQQQSSDSRHEAELSGLDHLAQIVTTYG